MVVLNIIDSILYLNSLISSGCGSPSVGGTNPMNVFKHIDDNDINVDSMVCITDMGFTQFPSHVDYPLLWVSTDLSVDKPPIGEITYLNI